MHTDPIALVSTLIEAGSIDTVYRDLYLGRAQTLLSPLISLEDFHRLQQQQAAPGVLPPAAAPAPGKGDRPLGQKRSHTGGGGNELRTQRAKNPPPPRRA